MRKPLLYISVVLLLACLLPGCKCEHEWQEADCVTPKTCLKCSETEGESLGHEWQEADCLNPMTCEVCGVTEGEKGDHRWKNATCTEPKTCNICGKTQGEALGHQWQDPDCETPKTCTACGITEGEPLGHDPAYACREDAECSRCGAEIKASGHVWTAATCTEPKTCQKCGETEGLALEHDVPKLGCGEPATCSRCGEKIRSADHDWTEATCFAPKTCKICNATEGTKRSHSTTSGNCQYCGKYIENGYAIVGGVFQEYRSYDGQPDGEGAMFFREDGHYYNVGGSISIDTDTWIPSDPWYPPEHPHYTIFGGDGTWYYSGNYVVCTDDYSGETVKFPRSCFGL